MAKSKGLHLELEAGYQIKTTSAGLQIQVGFERWFFKGLALHSIEYRLNIKKMFFFHTSRPSTGCLKNMLNQKYRMSHTCSLFKALVFGRVRTPYYWIPLKKKPSKLDGPSTGCLKKLFQENDNVYCTYLFSISLK